MSEHSPTPVDQEAMRAEKLRAIAAVFGESVAARIGDLPPCKGKRSDEGDDRVAWQTNRLIGHLRARLSDAEARGEARPSPSVSAAAKAVPVTRPKPRPTRQPEIPSLMIGEDLALEHPAVIAHMLRPEPQSVRVSVLKALPGQLSRDVMRRLRGA